MAAAAIFQEDEVSVSSYNVNSAEKRNNSTIPRPTFQDLVASLTLATVAVAKTGDKAAKADQENARKQVEKRPSRFKLRKTVTSVLTARMAKDKLAPHNKKRFSEYHKQLLWTFQTLLSQLHVLLTCLNTDHTLNSDKEKETLEKHLMRTILSARKLCHEIELDLVPEYIKFMEQCPYDDISMTSFLELAKLFVMELKIYENLKSSEMTEKEMQIRRTKAPRVTSGGRSPLTRTISKLSETRVADINYIKPFIKHTDEEILIRIRDGIEEWSALVNGLQVFEAEAFTDLQRKMDELDENEIMEEIHEPSVGRLATIKQTVLFIACCMCRCKSRNQAQIRFQLDSGTSIEE